jgi:hypothetical protein
MNFAAQTLLQGLPRACDQDTDYQITGLKNEGYTMKLRINIMLAMAVLAVIGLGQVWKGQAGVLHKADHTLIPAPSGLDPIRVYVRAIRQGD